MRICGGEELYSVVNKCGINIDNAFHPGYIGENDSVTSITGDGDIVKKPEYITISEKSR